MKIILIIAILYLGYRLFVGPPLLGPRNQRPPGRRDDDDGYTDYEELP